MYFQPKEGLNVEANGKKLFDLCSKVLKDYCLQQSELVSIMNSKREESHSRHSSINAPAATSMHDDIVLEKVDPPEEMKSAEGGKEQLLLNNLHENELERQLQNMTPIVSNIILANLLLLSEDDVSITIVMYWIQLKKHVKEVGPLLIDLSVCNNYEIRLANRELLCRMFEFLTAKLY